MTSPPPADRRGRGLRLQSRLALSFSLLVGAAVAVLAAVSLYTVRTTFDRLYETRLAGLESRAERRIDVERETVARRVRQLGELLRATERATLERLVSRPAPGDFEAQEGARRLQQLLDLDQLLFFDDEGRVVASADRPELGGTLRPRLVAVPDVPSLGWIERSIGREAAVLMRGEAAIGDERVSFVAGIAIDAEAIEPGADAAALLLAPSGAVAARSARGEQFDPVAVSSAFASPRSVGPLALTARDGAGWSAAAATLTTWDGEPLGKLVLAVDRSTLDALVAGLGRRFLWFGALAALLAAMAGWWIAVGLTRPIENLVQAVDRIALGDADYTFPRPAQHELDDLVTSFSRLHRSLARQQERTIAAERVAAWREIARRVAHEIKNPLMPIRLTLENLRKARTRDAAVFDEMFDSGTRTALEEVDRLRRLVDEFSGFARLPEPKRRTVDVDRLIDDLMPLYANDPVVQVRRRRDGALPPLRLDADQIAQAVKNVVGNAVHAARQGGGHVTLRTAVEGGDAVIEVCDDGPGFAAEALRRVFEPYFTTKPDGTGLGMAISYRIVTEHGGYLRAENAGTGGARVRIGFPVDDAEGHGSD